MVTVSAAYEGPEFEMGPSMLCRKPQIASSNVHNYHEHDWSSLLNNFTYGLINVSSSSKPISQGRISGEASRNAVVRKLLCSSIKVSA